MAEGLDTHELDIFEGEVLKFINNTMPKESKKFMKKEANALNKVNKSEGNKIGYVTGNFEKGFKSGKVYEYDGSWCVRAYNSSPHAHLLNDGFIWTPHKKRHLQPNGEEKWIPGFDFLGKAKEKFESGYYKSCEDFINDMMERL